MLVYVPRENYNTECEAHAADSYAGVHGISSEFTLHLSTRRWIRELITVRTKAGKRARLRMFARSKADRQGGAPLGG